MGYRFIVSDFSYSSEIKNGKALNLSFKVVNTGSSPFYYNWPVEVSLLDAKTHQKVWGKTLDNINISKWMPGDDWVIEKDAYQKPASINEVKSTISIDKDLPNGEYIIALSVLDPAGMLPSLRFANENYFEGGSHPVSYTHL